MKETIQRMYETMSNENFMINIERLKLKVRKGLIPNVSIDEIDSIVSEVLNNSELVDEHPEEVESAEERIGIIEMELDGAEKSLTELLEGFDINDKDVEINKDKIDILEYLENLPFDSEIKIDLKTLEVL